jgi:anti-sigma factor RsiW
MNVNEHPDALLPWYVNRTLDRAERDQVEHHLATCVRCRDEVLLLEGLRAHVQSEEVTPPTELGLKRLLRDVKAERRRNGSLWWRRAAAAAIVVVVIQAGLLANLYRQPPDTFRTLGDVATEAMVQVRFSPEATEARIRALLQETGAVFVDGPSASGVYRLRLTTDPANEEAMDRHVARLRQSGIVEHVARE